MSQDYKICLLLGILILFVTTSLGYNYPFVAYDTNNNNILWFDEDWNLKEQTDYGDQTNTYEITGSLKYENTYYLAHWTGNEVHLADRNGNIQDKLSTQDSVFGVTIGPDERGEEIVYALDSAGRVYKIESSGENLSLLNTYCCFSSASRTIFYDRWENRWYVTSNSDIWYAGSGSEIEDTKQKEIFTSGDNPWGLARLENQDFYYSGDYGDFLIQERDKDNLDNIGSTIEIPPSHGSFGLNWGVAFSENNNFCNYRGPFNECIMNRTNQLNQQQYNVSSIFEAREDAVFEAFDGVATLNLTNSTRISGLWRGEFNINAEAPRLKAGAEFRPKNGRIMIGE